jgi:hypothetical protein
MGFYKTSTSVNSGTPFPDLFGGRTSPGPFYELRRLRSPELLGVLVISGLPRLYTCGLNPIQRALRLSTRELRSRADLADELILGITILSSGGRTTVPRKVMELLELRYTPQKREKILWMQEGDEVVVSKGTPQSSFRKTILSRGGKAAVPRHIREALKLKSTPQREERMIWIRKEERIIVRKGPPRSIPTD